MGLDRAMAAGPGGKGPERPRRRAAGLTLMVALVVAIACQSGTAPPTVQPTQPTTYPKPATGSAPTPATTPETTAAPSVSATTAATATAGPTSTTPASSTAVKDRTQTTANGTPSELTALAFEYWDAFNAYDADEAVAMLEPAYRAAEEEPIRRDIGRMRMFRAKLDLSEETPPVLMESGLWEMFMSMGTPIGAKRIRMEFVEDGGRWYISFADEVEPGADEVE